MCVLCVCMYVNVSVYVSVCVVCLECVYVECVYVSVCAGVSICVCVVSE